MNTIINSASYPLSEKEAKEPLKPTEEINKRVPVTEVTPFQNNFFTPVPTAALMFSSIQAQTNKELWRADENGIAYLRYTAKNNPNNYINHYIGSPGDITLLPWDEAQQIIDKFGFTTAKLHLLLAAHSIRQKKPWESNFSLKASDIIKEFGWDKSHKKPQSEKLLEIANTAFALDCMLVKAVWIEGRNRNGGIDASIPVGRMWNIGVELQGQINLLAGNVNNPNEVYLNVQPGAWTQHFLNKAGAKSREALYQFGYLAQQVLKIDPYHNELALKLAIHLTLDSRVRLNGEYKVRELLDITLPKSVMEQAQLEFRKAYELKRRWDNALLLLRKLDWQIRFDEETYPEWLRPEAKDNKPKGYIKKFLEAKITIRPPAPIPDLLASKKEELKLTKPDRKLSPGAVLSGEQVREARNALGWSQSQLAVCLGLKGKSLISRIESGQRSITPQMEAKLRKLLNI
jgi:DNA-binding XRE family transcriptional regulator